MVHYLERKREDLKIELKFMLEGQLCLAVAIDFHVSRFGMVLVEIWAFVCFSANSLQSATATLC